MCRDGARENDSFARDRNAMPTGPKFQRATAERDIPSGTTIDAAPSWREMAAAKKNSRLLGVQGRLMLSFCAVLFASMGMSAYIVLRDIGVSAAGRFNDNTRTLAQSLANGAEGAVARRDVMSLERTASSLLRADATRLIAFRDVDCSVIASRSLRVKDAAATSDASLVPPMPSEERLGQAILRRDDAIGSVIDVTEPVFATNPLDPQASELVGYVTVVATTSGVDAGIQQSTQMLAIAGVITALMALPISGLLVRSIFHPARELTAAAKRIMSGDLSVQLLVTSRDAFGELANTFNELVRWERRHRADLARVNEQLADSNADLAMKVEARTHQLEASNQRLAGEIAEKEDFIRAVSHDLNAPLRNIGGMVAMLLLKHKDTLAPEILQRLDRVKKNVDVGSDLISELLELSRIKTRRQKMEIVETERMVWELRGLFENDLRTKHIELVVDTVMPNLFSEKARMRQIFQNLIDNAIKYMGERPVREIHVGCTVNQAEAEFYVRDTGTGIPAEDLDKVFFVFRRGRSEQTQKTAGKGVGLASVKSIVENYHGKIWVTSQVNEGTTFHFTINGRYVPSVSGMTEEQMKALNDPNGEDAAPAAPPALKAA
jgi:signal transduction histidine kinase